MAVLDAEQRRGMSQSEFGLPGKRFPMNDPTHDRLAISGATRAERAGNISPSQEAQVKSEARAKLGSQPRDHSLTMASATHLHRAGYISSAHHAAIRQDAAKKLAVHKAKKPSGAYGSMAPQSAGHYLSTTNPSATMDDQGGGSY